MPKITLTVEDTIRIVLNNDDVLSLVKQKYLESTPPEFDLSELEALVSDTSDDDEPEADESETDTDSLALSETTVSGKAGDTLTVQVTAAG
ncbi:hypothetical protein FRO67_005353, partial [Escherichia coli]|nr:hypothetical protein [Escherichia coli]